MKVKILGISLALLAVGTVALTGCNKSDYSEGGSQSASAPAGKTAGGGDKKAPTSQDVKAMPAPQVQ